MKVLRGMLLSVLFIFMGITAVLAEDTTEYTVDEIGIKFQVPSSILSYTRTSGISDDVMKALGYTTEEYKEHLIETMTEEDTYMIAFDANVTYRVYLTSVYSSKASYNMKSDEEILALVEEGLDGELTELGTDVKESSVFTENDRKFAVVELKDSTGDCYLYATVENHQAYYFYIRAYSGGITDAHRSLIKQIAGSSEFIEKKEAVTQASAGLASSGDSKGTDTKGNVNFISTFIKLVGIIIVFFIVIILLIMLSSKLSRKKKGPKTHYSTRRDAAYEERLKRVMSDDYDKDKQ